MRKESFQGILLGIVIMCAVFAFITVAWAALSTTLTIDGYASVNAQKWKIGFDDEITNDKAVLSSASTVTCAADPSSGGPECPLTAPSLTGDTFGQSSGNAMDLGTLINIDDSLTYTWYIVNEGSFDAYINSATGVNPSTGVIGITCTEDNGSGVYGTTSEATAFCDALSATLKVNNSTTFLGQKIDKVDGSTITSVPVELSIKYVGGFTENQVLPSHKVKVSLTSPITLVYTQTTTAVVSP